MLFTDADIRQIESEGLTVERVREQIEIFRRGVSPVRLNRPCTISDGIETLKKRDIDSIVELYDEAAGGGRVLKFVPASGAASRMFRDWHKCIEHGGFESADEGEKFFGDLKIYAFFGDLKDIISRDGQDIEDLIESRRLVELISYIITSRGLNYGSLPKALLKFHRYPEGSRTSLQEHIVEAVHYARDINNVCRIHFTVSEEHLNMVILHVSEVKGVYEDKYGVTFDLAFSTQRSSTNTIAVSSDNVPFRDPQGQLVFRPGGHGALLENLDGIDGDIILVKNIDNVVPDGLKHITVIYKKLLAGLLVQLQKEIFRYLDLLASGMVDEDTVLDMSTFCEKRLYMVFPPEFAGFSLRDKCHFIYRKLNRPIRVCGMVRNEGEPGGGPFWVDEEDGTQSLQIVEESQIDSDSEQQRKIWASSTHFNPVDLACGVRDFRSRKFNLQDFVDRDAHCISKKSERGSDIKALEFPGLWNGSMADWITVFVEVPIETFNPVKNVQDLLRPQHLPQS